MLNKLFIFSAVLMKALFAQIPLCIQRSHTATACSSYGLPVNLILHIARGKYSSPHWFLRYPGTVVMYPASSKFIQPLNISLLGWCPMATKNALTGTSSFSPLILFFMRTASHLFFTQHLVCLAVPVHFDICCFQYPVLHHFTGPHFAPAHNHVHYGTQFG